LRNPDTPPRTTETWEEWIGKKEEETNDKTLFEYIHPNPKKPHLDRGIPTLVNIKVIGVWDTVGALGLPDSWYKWARSFVVKDGGELLNTSLNHSM
jgi:T6SS, Phospholipase effector Tle1-like, catalytic domain